MKKIIIDLEMKTSVICLLLFTALNTFGQKKQVCFTYDDLPVVSYGINDTGYQQDLTEKLVLSLQKNGIPAIGFVNEKKLYTHSEINPFQVNLLKMWLDHGLELGNHTFSHPDYNTVSFSFYSQDILKGEMITKEILESRGQSIKYFRHPFLHVGNSQAKADSLSNFLREHNYTEAPVTIDNDDYLFAVCYKKAKVKDDRPLMLQIGHDYVTYMEQKLHYFENQVNRLFGRNINQILLLHASALNADYTDSLAFMFRKNNYDFVSLDKILKDSVYESAVTVYGNWGISWIDKWALSQGKKGDFFNDEPLTPDYIKKLSQ